MFIRIVSAPRTELSWTCRVFFSSNTKRKLKRTDVFSAKGKRNYLFFHYLNLLNEEYSNLTKTMSLCICVLHILRIIQLDRIIQLI